MKKLSFLIGLCLLSAGIGIILASFLPDGFLAGIEALLLIVAGLTILCRK